MAKVFSQKPGFDFQDTSSPVFKTSAVRIILTLALTHKWILRQVDVNNAFLHGELNKDVYMTQSPEFEQCDKTGKVLICKLHKALYGLKQVPRV